MEDRERGNLVNQDRIGKVLHYPFIKLTLGTVSDENKDEVSLLQVLKVAKELLNMVRDSSKIYYFKDKRTD